MPGAQRIALGLCALFWGLCALLQGFCIAPGAPSSAPRALHCSGALYSAPGALYTTPRALCIALELCTPLQGSVHHSGALYTAPRASAHCHLTVSLRTAGAAKAAALSCPQQLLHHCHVAASVSISVTAAHCRCPRTHQHQPGPSRPTTHGLLLLQHPASPQGTLITQLGAAHPHQQPGPGCVPACHGGVGSSTATGNLLLYIDIFGVVFSIFMDNWGFGLVWFF